MKRLSSRRGVLLSVLLLAIVGGCDIHRCLYPTSTLTIKNSTDKTIVAAFVVAQEETAWGENLLLEVIPADDETVLEEIDKQEVKIKVSFDDGTFVTKEKVDLSKFEKFVLRIEIGEETSA